MQKYFEGFMSQLKETNQTLDFFCDFDKISHNVENIKLSLCSRPSKRRHRIFHIDLRDELVMKI